MPASKGSIWRKPGKTQSIIDRQLAAACASSSGVLCIRVSQILWTAPTAHGSLWTSSSLNCCATSVYFRSRCLARLLCGLRPSSIQSIARQDRYQLSIPSMSMDVSSPSLGLVSWLLSGHGKLEYLKWSYTRSYSQCHVLIRESRYAFPPLVSKPAAASDLDICLIILVAEYYHRQRYWIISSRYCQFKYCCSNSYV